MTTKRSMDVRRSAPPCAPGGLALRMAVDVPDGDLSKPAAPISADCDVPETFEGNLAACRLDGSFVLVRWCASQVRMATRLPADLQPAQAAAIAGFCFDAGPDGPALAQHVNSWLTRRCSLDESGGSSDESDCGSFTGMVALLAAGLKTLPSYSGVVYRACPGTVVDMQKVYTKGAHVVWPGITSVSRNIDVARTHFIQPPCTVFAITAKAARLVGDLAAIPEGEMLIEPNSEFTVTGTDVRCGVAWVEMVQTETTAPILSAIERARSPHRHHRKHKHVASNSSGSVSPSGKEKEKEKEKKVSSPTTNHAAVVHPEDGAMAAVRSRSRTKSDDALESSTTPPPLVVPPKSGSPSTAPLSPLSPVPAGNASQRRKAHSSQAILSVDPTSGSVSSASAASLPSPGTPSLGSGSSSNQLVNTKVSPHSERKPPTTKTLTTTMWQAMRSYVQVRSPTRRGPHKTMHITRPPWCHASSPMTSTRNSSFVRALPIGELSSGASSPVASSPRTPTLLQSPQYPSKLSHSSPRSPSKRKVTDVTS